MSEWLKSITGLLVKKEPGETTLRDRIEAEQRRLREATERNASGRTVAEEQILLHEDLKALQMLLAWKLDVKAENLLANPAKVDGLWFGVKRYFREGKGENAAPMVSWKLYVHRVCPNCKHAIPTLELGDHAEVTEAVEQMAHGKETEVSKSTTRLARYIADVEANHPDPYCPRFCPQCRKPIRGGTI